MPRGRRYIGRPGVHPYDRTWHRMVTEDAGIGGLLGRRPISALGRVARPDRRVIDFPVWPEEFSAADAMNVFHRMDHEEVEEFAGRKVSDAEYERFREKQDYLLDIGARLRDVDPAGYIALQGDKGAESLGHELGHEGLHRLMEEGIKFPKIKVPGKSGKRRVFDDEDYLQFIDVMDGKEPTEYFEDKWGNVDELMKNRELLQAVSGMQQAAASLGAQLEAVRPLTHFAGATGFGDMVVAPSGGVPMFGVEVPEMVSGLGAWENFDWF